MTPTPSRDSGIRRHPGRCLRSVLSTDSVGKAGDAAERCRCVARVCEGVARGGDFMGDGRAVGLRPEPLRVSAYRLHPYRKGHCSTRAAPQAACTSAKCQRQARREAPAPQEKACLIRHSGLACARQAGRGIRRCAAVNGASPCMVRVRFSVCESAGRFSAISQARDFLRLSGSG